jgi:hypothetical protein
MERGAKVDGTNEDGNTPLHVAAFLCHKEIVQLLLDKGASALTKNKRGETAIDVVSGAWSKPLGDFYTGIARSTGQEIDLDRIEKVRPQIAELLQTHVDGGEKAEDKE